MSTFWKTSIALCTLGSFLMGMNVTAQQVPTESCDCIKKPATPVPKDTIERKELDVIWSSILTEIGDPIANDVSQCAVIPIGAKACGGPTTILCIHVLLQIQLFCITWLNVIRQ
jgi:hypothetical protein